MAARHSPRTIGFDSKRFYWDVRMTAKARGYTLDRMCIEVGIDNASFSRYGTVGTIPEGAILAALCKWANLNAANYSIDLRGECDA